MKLISIWREDAQAKPDLHHVDTCDGIRVLAILLVGWFHIWQQSWLYPEITIFGYALNFEPLVRSGYICVDVMILISGFCLYLPWARLRYTQGVRPDPLDFYIRRLIRIHPSYLLTLLVMGIVAAVQHAYRAPINAVRDILTHLTYTHTFFYDTYVGTNLGGTLWTLAIEMQFYLIFPLLARACFRAPVITLAAMMSLSITFRGYIGANVADVSMLFNQLPAYLDTFALGMAAAHVHAWVAQRRHGALLRIACSAGTVLAMALFWRVARMQASSSGTEAIRLAQLSNRLWTGLIGAMLLVCSANAGLLVRRVLGNPLTRFLSAISMQFYIWHQTLAVWILQARLVPSAVLHPNYEGDIVWQRRYTLACFGLAIALSTLLTYGFERPVAKCLQAWWSKRRNRAE